MNSSTLVLANLPVVSIFEEIADAVLSVARRVQSPDLDVLTKRKRRVVARRIRDMRAVLAADDGDGVVLQRLGVAARVVMAVGISARDAIAAVLLDTTDWW